MSADGNPYGTWTAEPEPDATRPASARLPLAGTPSAPAPIWLRAGLGLGVLAALAVVVIELLRVGPFAPATVPASVPSAQAVPEAITLPVALPAGTWTQQFVATGNPAGGTSGPVEVRAWKLTSHCDAHGGCAIELARQLAVPSAPNETVDRTALRRLDRTGSSVEYLAAFPPVQSRCGSQTASATDRFLITWASGTGSISASERSGYRCAGAAYASSYSWNAVPVAPPAARALAANPQHASTAARFLRAATSVCRNVNTAAQPLARAVAGDRAVIVAANAGAGARARAEDDLARRVQALLPLAERQYTDTLQPPSGALDRWWLRDVRLNGAALRPGAAMLDALAAAARAQGRFFRTGDGTAHQTALADLFLAGDDAVALSASGAASAAIERKRLHLPQICLDPPAVRSIFAAAPLPSAA